MESKSQSISLPSLVEHVERLSQISPNSCSDDAFHFDATGDDPKIFFPKMDLEPVGAIFKLDITLPREAMVQLFYQTIHSFDFNEDHSVSIFHYEGRHSVEWVIDKPLNGFFRLDPGNHSGSYIIHKIEVIQNYYVKSIIPKNIIAEKLQYSQIRDLRFTENGLKFKSVGRDPWIVFPKIDLWPKSATVRLEITLQRQAMVQLYFQTDGKHEFAEEFSVSESRPAGHHRIEWIIDQPLTGVFRLDPGNMPWEYEVHKLELFQLDFLTKIPNDQIFSHGGYTHQIEQIQLENGELSFQATGKDPYVILPKVNLQSNRIRICVEITVPEEVLVQLFYQKNNNVDFVEEDSCKELIPAGRHSIQWIIHDSLNGFFRLDPGNQPGKYMIHQIEYGQMNSKSLPHFSHSPPFSTTKTTPVSSDLG